MSTVQAVQARPSPAERITQFIERNRHTAALKIHGAKLGMNFGSVTRVIRILRPRIRRLFKSVLRLRRKNRQRTETNDHNPVFQRKVHRGLISLRPITRPAVRLVLSLTWPAN